MRYDWDEIQVLLALLRVPSLTAAARTLAVDRSTVSRRVAALEERLGAPLFLRTRDGLVPSLAAERLRPHAERLDAELRAFELAAFTPAGKPAGIVRVATTEALATFLVQSGLLELQAEFPDVVVELLGGNQALDVSRGEAEIALRLRPPTEAALRARVVARMELGLYAARTYLAARGTPRDDLCGHDALVAGGELAHLPEATWLTGQPGVRVTLRSNSMPAIVAACAAGRGLAVLTRPWGALEPGLELVRALPELGVRPLWLVVQPEMAERPEVRVVVDQIVAIAGRFQAT